MTVLHPGIRVHPDPRLYPGMDLAALSSSDLAIHLSGGAGNASGPASIGGPEGDAYTGSLSELFAAIPGTVAAAGGTFYRVVYVRNTHLFDSLADAAVFIGQQFGDAHLELAVAVPPQAAGQTVPALASATTPPAGATFTTASDRDTGEAFGTLAPGESRGLYLRLRIAPVAPPVDSIAAAFAVEGDPA